MNKLGSFKRRANVANVSKYNFSLGRMLTDVQGHYLLPNCLRIFPFYRLRQRPHGGCDQSAEDAHSSMVSDSTFNFWIGPFLFCLCFAFFLWTFCLNTVRYQHISSRQCVLITIVYRACVGLIFNENGIYVWKTLQYIIIAFLRNCNFWKM